MEGIENQKVLKDKYNPEGSELRNAQYRMLEMLCYIDKICLENDITYWLDCGTLLGAVRHGGFIPWDDDSDICMPINDAKRFKAIMQKKYNAGEFVLQCRESDPGFFGPWLILRDRKSEYLQDSHMHRARKYRGLQVDIFTVSDHNISFLRRVSVSLENRLITQPLLKWRFSKPLELACRFWYQLLYSFVFKVFDELGLLFSNKQYYTYTYGTAFGDKHLITPIFPLKRIQFEGKVFNVPNDTDRYLTENYGNWRRIPKDNEILTHHVNVKFYDEIR
jgi:lipopolysaccharide cholinephosphotransferase